MSSRRVLLVVLLALSTALSTAPARAVEHAPPRKIKVVVAAPPIDPDLITYYVGVLTRGRRAGDWTQDERRKIQAAQTAYINRLAREGKLLVTGPITDDSEWRGIYIFKCATLAEAEALAAADPEVRAGLLRIEVHAWQTEKGAIRDAALSRPK